MSRKLRGLSVLGLIVLSFVGCGGMPEDLDSSGRLKTASNAADVWLVSSSIWYTPVIPVCWENPTAADAQQRGWVRNAIAQTWEAVSRLSFTGWGTCAPGAWGIRIQIADNANGALSRGTGSQLNGVVNGIVLNLTYRNWVTSCRITNPDGTTRVNQNCVQVDAIHEFGHALGFPHEHDRPDKPASCTSATGTKGDYFLDGYDGDSIVNYCNPRNTNRMFVTANPPPMYILSANDVRGVQQLYGAKPNTLVGFWGKCIDLNGSAFVDGTRLVTAHCSNRAEQRWALDWIQASATPWTGRLRSLLGQKVAAPVNLSMVDGTPLELRPQNNSLQAQAWMMSRSASDMTIRGHGGRCMDVINNNSANGTQLHLWGCGPYVTTNGAQLWRRDELGRIINKNGKCLEVPAGQSANGTRVRMWTCNSNVNNANQVWNLESPGRIKSLSSGKCIDALNFQTDGAPLVIWDCNSFTNQHWSFRGPIRTRPSVDTAYKCMNITADAVGTPVGVGACTGSEWQLFDYHW